MMKMALYLFGLPLSNPSFQDYHKKYTRQMPIEEHPTKYLTRSLRTIKIIKIKESQRTCQSYKETKETGQLRDWILKVLITRGKKKSKCGDGC